MRRSGICVTLGIVIGLTIGWLDLHTTEVTVTILALPALVAFAFALVGCYGGVVVRRTSAA